MAPGFLKDLTLAAAKPTRALSAPEILITFLATVALIPQAIHKQLV